MKVKSNKYDETFYSSGPVSFTDFVNNKYTNIHNQLYNSALQKYLADNPEYLLYRTSYNFVEIPQQEYWQASYVNIISKKYPFSKKKVWLDEYWSKYQEKNINTDYNNIYIDEDTIKDAKIVYINYVTGEVTMKSKFTGVEFKVPFSKVNGNTPVTDFKK